MKFSSECIHFFKSTRPKPAYGRQGLGWDRQARIQFRQVQFGDTFWGNIYFLKYSGSGFPLLQYGCNLFFNRQKRNNDMDVIYL